ncbi:MAG: ABC transporter ATP-binding protein [Clostridiales bacterium]|nr:ABC transporter ATP-binding protein [Clostridiales bacterium]
MISAKNLTRIYNSAAGKVAALNNVSLEIPPGELVSVIGESGSGKSTLMNILGCLDVPTGGEYRLNGKLVSALDHDTLSKIRNSEIGFIFQSFNLLSRLTALENVELPLIYAKIPRAKRRELSLSALDKVGLSSRVTHKPAELSGGQQQRVAIARAIAMNPSLILADEPTGNLDSESGAEVLSLLTGLNDKGATVIIITHDYNTAKKARRIVRISAGRIEYDIKT